MAKGTLINGKWFVDHQRPRLVLVYVPLPVLDRIQEIQRGMDNGTYTQAQGDDLYNTHVRPYVKLPRRHNPETDIVEFRVKKAVRSIIVPR